MKPRKSKPIRRRRIPRSELAVLASEVLDGPVDEVKATMQPVNPQPSSGPVDTPASPLTATPSIPSSALPAGTSPAPDLTPASVSPPGARGGGPAFHLRPLVAGPVPPPPAAAPADEPTAGALRAAEEATPPAPESAALARREDAELERCSPERAKEITRSLLRQAMRGGATVILRRKTKPHGFGVIDTWRFVPYPTEDEIEPLYQKVPPELEAFIRRHPEWFAIPELVIDLIDYGERAAAVVEQKMEEALQRRERLKAMAKAKAAAASEAAPVSSARPQPSTSVEMPLHYQDNHGGASPTPANDGPKAKVVPFTGRSDLPST